MLLCFSVELQIEIPVAFQIGDAGFHGKPVRIDLDGRTEQVKSLYGEQ